MKPSAPCEAILVIMEDCEAKMAPPVSIMPQPMRNLMVIPTLVSGVKHEAKARHAGKAKTTIEERQPLGGRGRKTDSTRQSDTVNTGLSISV